MSKATYITVPLEKLPGCFLDVPVNRAARRIEDRKNRLAKVPQRFRSTSAPIVLLPKGYFRANRGTLIWRTSQRKGVRKINRLINKQLNKRRLNESTNN